MTEDGITFGEPSAWYDRDTYTFLYTSPSGEKLARIQYDYINEEKDKITAEATVWWMFGERDDVLPIVGPVRINFFNPTRGQGGWGGVVQTCSDRVADVDWHGGVQRTIQLSVNHFRNSDETQKMVLREIDEADEPFLLKPWISSTGTTLMYAPGGTGKSMVALAMAVSVSTGKAIFGAVPEKIGPVLYIDYEDDSFVHELRMNAICRALEGEVVTPPIFHLGLTGSVRSSIKRIKGAVVEHGVVLIVLDSVGLARGADPNSAGETIDLFKYLRDTGVPVLAIDHVRKEHIEKIRGGNINAETVMAFGSQYSMSSSRLAWFLREMPTSTGTVKRFNAHNTKHNHVAKQETRALIMTLGTTDRGVIEEISFEIKDTLFHEVVVEAETGREMLLKAWINNGGAMTHTMWRDRLGKANATIAGWLNDDSKEVKPWFMKLPKQGREIFYTLTDEGKFRTETLIGGHDEG